MARHRSARGMWWRRIALAALLAPFLVVAVMPIAYAFWNSLRSDDGFTLAAYRHVLLQGRQWTLLGNTLAIATGSAALATLIGAAFALALEYVRVPARRVLLGAGVIPLLIPSYIIAMAWVDLFGANGLLQRSVVRISGAAWTPPALNTVFGAIVISALSFYPVVLLTTRLALRRFDARFEEAARLASGKGRTLALIVLPLLAPSIVAGSLIVFLLSLVNFAAPSLLQVNVYAVEVFTAFSAFYDSSAAIAQSLPLVVCGLAALGVGALYIGPRSGWLSGAARTQATPRGGSALRILSAAGCWAVIALSTGAPMGVLVWRSLPLSTYAEAFATARDEILTSLIVASASATLITVFGASLAYSGTQRAPFSPSGRAARRVPSILCLIPFLVSGPVLAVALIALWNRPGLPGMVYDSIMIVVFACAARFTFFAERGMSASMSDLHPRLTEAALVFGVSRWRQALRILLPLTWPVALGVWGLSFVFSLGEVDATALLCPPGRNTLTMRLFSLMHYGPSPMVAALCVLTVALILFCGGGAAMLYTYSARLVSARTRGAHGHN